MAILISVAQAMETPKEIIIDAATQGDVVAVISNDGKVQVLNDAAVDLSGLMLTDQTTDLVEKFLRRAMLAYEELIHPTQYSPLVYLLPGDDLGVIDKNGSTKSIKSDEAPDVIRQSMGQSMNERSDTK